MKINGKTFLILFVLITVALVAGGFTTGYLMDKHAQAQAKKQAKKEAAAKKTEPATTES